MKRFHFFNVTTCDAEGRIVSSVIRHTDKNITSQVITHQLAEVNAYQPVAVTGLSYLGFMSNQYFDSGIKTLSDWHFPRWLSVLLLVVISGLSGAALKAFI